ncbi:MAG: hypothetical protein PUE92_01520 [Catenibacterium mitsuokai]|nr:hypothetical protein [Catenibacterium mitsuokai]MDD6594716.1 hypothetical protein [Catenibacterium mitsuokai]
MSKKINVRTVLKKHKLGLSENKIAQTCHMSKHSVKAVLGRLRDIEFELSKIDNNKKCIEHSKRGVYDAPPIYVDGLTGLR